jgi:hypothetical protein
MSLQSTPIIPAQQAIIVEVEHHPEAAEQPIIAPQAEALVEVDVELDIIPEPIMYPQGAIIPPQELPLHGQAHIYTLSAIFHGDVVQLGVIAAAT